VLLNLEITITCCNLAVQTKTNKAMAKITKKQFKEVIRFEEYTGRLFSGKKVKAYVVYYDWRTDFTGDKNIVGYKYAIGGVSVKKNDLINVAYNWIINGDQQVPFEIQYKFARTDEYRFKVPLSYPFAFNA